MNTWAIASVTFSGFGIPLLSTTDLIAGITSFNSSGLYEFIILNCKPSPIFWDSGELTKFVIILVSRGVLAT